jgi:pyruvate/2-oxoglutarate dehydrogenase complex dihydrolipoamide acyltransferase (E2) component
MADITMPKMGFDMTEGLIVRWLKKVGDHRDRVVREWHHQ